MSAKYLVGIDGSLRDTGVVVLNNMGELVEEFSIKTKAGMLDHNSVDHIVETFFDRINKYLEVDGMPVHKSVSFFIEDIQFVRKKGNDKPYPRAEAWGTLKWLLRQEGVNIYGVDPGAANSFLDARFDQPKTNVVNGRKVKRNSKDQKAHTMDVLHRFRNFWTKNHNIADAYVMALFGYAVMIEKQRLSYKSLCQIRY